MCSCIKKVDEKLAEYNGMLETNWLSDPPRAMISIVKKATASKRKPPLMEATHCPFCGKRYPKKRDLASYVRTTVETA